METQAIPPLNTYERYQQLLWDRCCKIAKSPERFAEPEYVVIRALRAQIIDLRQVLFSDIEESNGVLDPRVSEHVLLREMRGKLLNVLDKKDRVSRKLLKRYFNETFKPQG